MGNTITINGEKRFEYNGFTMPFNLEKGDDGYYLACIYSPDNRPVEKNVGKYFMGNDEKMLYERFKKLVDYFIDIERYNDTQDVWTKTDESEVINCVFNILPEKFYKLIKEGRVTKSLIEKVGWGHYEVPLYYTTKAWDFLLKGKVGNYSFMMGPEEEEDYSEDLLQEFIHDEYASRTRSQAMADNDAMKEIWKNEFAIDIDNTFVDFLSFNRKLPPNVDYETFWEYYEEVPNGVVEWIMFRINHPEEKCTFDSVSTLMEFAAMVGMERTGGLFFPEDEEDWS